MAATESHEPQMRLAVEVVLDAAVREATPVARDLAPGQVVRAEPLVAL
jgi:hypothetical protein